MTLAKSDVLTGGLADEIVIKISDSELNQIKANTEFAVSNKTVFLAISENATEDIVGNLLVGRSYSESILPDEYIPDEDSPNVKEFEIILIQRANEYCYYL